MEDTLNIIYHLAAEYNNVVFAESSSYIPREINSAEELCMSINVDGNESEDDINTRLKAIEDEMMLFIALSSCKRKPELANTSYLRSKKRGKYDTRQMEGLVIFLE